jgi:preprotein translocase subunit SecG
MKELLIVVHMLVAVGLVALVLLQQGKGADMGAAFGSGASQTLFGARGSATFLSRTTAILAVMFFLTSLGLTVVYSQQGQVKSVTEQLAPVERPEVPPAAPAAPSGVPEVPK